MKKWTGILVVILGLALLGGCSGEGTVEINSTYEGADIYIDGDLKGNMPSGAYGITLSEGKHEIELVQAISDPDKYDQYYAKKTITVADKSTQSISISLSRRQSPDYKAQWEEKQRKQMEAAIASIQSNIVTIPSGSFRMGSNENGNEKPVHTVHIDSFKMGKYEVTQAQWQAVMGNNPSYFKGANRPVENVNWDDIQVFIKKLNQQSGQHFRLPSEAEWEYAARAGTSSAWSWGNSKGSAGSYAWYDDSSGSKTHPVGKKKPNAFGLYEMHGNVWEWVQDCWNDSYHGAPANGAAWLSGSCSKRVLRGGSWYLNPYYMRSANRYWVYTDSRYNTFGFRLVQD